LLLKAYICSCKIWWRPIISICAVLLKSDGAE
jgi:hypothetical protein